MQNSTLFRRAAALLLTAALALTLVLPGLAAYEMPIQTVNEGESVYLFNADIDKPILEQNADQQRYIASLTKMMTALLFLESGKDMNAEITIPASLTQEFKDIQNANGSTINLRIGETVRRIDLLYGLLVASANDAASVIASDVSDGDLTAFVARMNQRAKELGCTSTSFTCVHGLYDYGNVSSAHDLALIAKACAENETYMQVANTLSYTLPATNLHQNERTITSTNLMLNPEYPYYRDYIRGMKTGFTTLAGRCYVTFAQKDGHTYGLVVLGSDLDNIYREASEILDWAFASFSDRELVDTETPLTTTPLKKCRSYEEVELYAAAPVSGYGHADDKVTFTYDLQENISATVKDGAVLAHINGVVGGFVVGDRNDVQVVAQRRGQSGHGAAPGDCPIVGGKAFDDVLARIKRHHRQIKPGFLVPALFLGVPHQEGFVLVQPRGGDFDEISREGAAYGQVQHAKGRGHDA